MSETFQSLTATGPGQDRSVNATEFAEPPKYQPESTPAGSISPPEANSPRQLSPHILVYYDKIPAQAMGRAGIEKMGYHVFAGFLFDAFILHPSRAPPRRGAFRRNTERKAFFQKYNYVKHHFCKSVKLMATFLRDSGGVDGQGSVMLQPVGWPEMISNVLEIKVECDLPDEYRKVVSSTAALSRERKFASDS